MQETTGLSGVGDRVLRGVADEEVVLDQAVVRVLREAEGREDEGVDDRLAEELEVRGAGADGGEVVGEEVVAGGEDGEGREGVELGEAFAGPGGAAEGVVEVDGAQGADALGVAFEVPEEGGEVDGGDEREVARAELRRGGVLSLDGIVGARARGVWQLGLPVPVVGRPTFWPGYMGACEPRRGGLGANGTSGRSTFAWRCRATRPGEEEQGMSKSTIRPICAARDHERALAAIDDLRDAKPGTEALDTLEVLTVLVEAYEREAFPIGDPDPVQAIRFRMEQLGLDQAALGDLLGSRSRASEILRRKRA